MCSHGKALTHGTFSSKLPGRDSAWWALGLEGGLACFGRPLIKDYSRPTTDSAVLVASDRSFLPVLAVVMTPTYPGGGKRLRMDPRIHK